MKVNITTVLFCSVALLGCSREFELEAQFAAVKIMPTNGLTTTESGGTVMLQVSLNYPPTSDVTLKIHSDNTNEGRIRATGNVCDSTSAATTLGICSMTFTTSNWNTAQTIVVVGQDDTEKDGTTSYAVLTVATSSDSRYQDLNAPRISLTNTDNDSGSGLIISPASGITTRESLPNMTTSFTVRLGSQPAGNVVFNNIQSDTPTEGTVLSATTLTFTAANWNIDQTVIITGVADNKIDGDADYRIKSDQGVGPAPYDKFSLDVSVKNINVDSGKYFFVTTNAYAVTVTAPLVAGTAGADAKCNAEKPTGGTYKAVLGAVNGGGTTIRDSGVDWVLAANTKYFRFADGALIGTTNGSRIFDLTTALNGSFAPGVTYWTGFSDGLWNVTAGSSCNAFLGGTGANIGDGNSTGQPAIKSGGGVLCSTAQRLLCAEQ